MDTTKSQYEHFLFYIIQVLLSHYLDGQKYCMLLFFSQQFPHSHLITFQKRFSFNYLLSFIKSMCHNWLFLKLLPSLTILFCEQDTVDVENANNYYEMVANLAGSEPDRIKVLVDMKSVSDNGDEVQVGYKVLRQMLHYQIKQGAI